MAEILSPLIRTGVSPSPGGQQDHLAERQSPGFPESTRLPDPGGRPAGPLRILAHADSG